MEMGTHAYTYMFIDRSEFWIGGLANTYSPTCKPFSKMIFAFSKQYLHVQFMSKSNGVRVKPGAEKGMGFRPAYGFSH